ncbi:MAG TPA: chemotaxis protein CheW [Thiolapillus brandeum]|uniref:Chemotaxis protein CheW n=1 Tax=Thiolapillus brandeum TaxID=1076588 RepID=A0A831WD51_9GAMM|nr:chemotaxis protein CheW [Thiolapillus brandeum]
MNSNAAQKIDVDLQSEQGVDQYLTFCLAGEEYGINILKVQEIRGWSEVTPMPNTPDSILGVINLRGTVVPIVELRSHFNLPDAPRGPTTVIIVVKAEEKNGNQRTMGMVVDAVSEVHNIASTDMQPAPQVGDAEDQPAIAGLATMDEHMIIILDVDDLMINRVLGLADEEPTTQK